MRSWILLGILLALAGCGEIPSSRAYVLMSDQLEEKSQLSHYRAELDSGDIARLDGKINFTETYYLDAPACAHIAADSYPTVEESEALRRWATLRADYFEQFHATELKTAAASEKVAPLAQRYVDALKEDLTRSTALISELAAGKMTYCTFATRQKAATLASATRAMPLHKQMVTAMAEEHYFDGTGLSDGGDLGSAAYGLGVSFGGSSPSAHLHSK